MLPPSMETARRWLGEGRRVVACTLVETVGSAPLDPGAEMLVDDTGRIEGSVTGGCVEGALVEEATGVLAGAPPRVATYGITDDEAVGVGLMCGGTVRVFVHELRDRAALDAAADAIAAGRPVALATLMDGPAAGGRIAVLGADAQAPDAPAVGSLATAPGAGSLGDAPAAGASVVGSLGGPALLQRSVARDAAGYLDEGRSTIRRYSAAGETMGSDLRVAIHAFATPPRMVVFGAIDFSAAVARIAGEIGYQVTIVDARAAFARSRRFSDHADVVIAWPQEYLAGVQLGPRDAVLVFTHDTKFDEPALLAALETGVGYIGALGSRRTVADREARLRELGVDAAGMTRIHSPCGLDVGARTPAETAVAVLAELLAVRAGRAGGPLGAASGPIHSAA